MAEPKFEKDLEKLEKIVEALEEGGLSLDDSLKRFEEGIKLAKRCEMTLMQAEKKIEILTKNAEGTLEARPFGEDDSAEEDQTASSKRQPGGDTAEGEEDEDELLF
jgi:exodeoxyribonuclease VII small subunit